MAFLWSLDCMTTLDFSINLQSRLLALNHTFATCNCQSKRWENRVTDVASTVNLGTSQNEGPRKVRWTYFDMFHSL